MKFRSSRENTERMVLAVVRTAYRPTGYMISKATGLGAHRVYPALARMEERGAITGHWEPTGRSRRRVYMAVPA